MTEEIEGRKRTVRRKRVWAECDEASCVMGLPRKTVEEEER